MQDIGTNFKHYSNFDMTSESQKIGLFVSTRGLLDGEYQSTTYIRFLSTFNLINSKYEICIINIDNENELQLVKDDLINDNFLLDIVIIERIAFESNDFLKLLIEKCKLLGISIIYETDDDLMNIDKTHKLYDFYHEKSLGIEYIVRNSDAVVVSTNYLKNIFIDFNPNITVIPNVLTDYWNTHVSKLNQDNIIKIGYVGTFSHNNDIKLLEDAISKVKKYFKNKNMEIAFELIGGTSNELNWANRIYFTLNDRPYPQFVKFLKKSIDWDVAVAPLEKSNINSSKSNLKYLEYAALGIPGIYSEIGPYKESIINGYNGLLVKDNTSNEWANNIINLIENKTLRKNIIKYSSEDVKDNYSISLSVEMWENVLNNYERDKKTKLYELFIKYKNNQNDCSFIEFISKNSHDIIEESGLFDGEWYLSQYEDSTENLIKHYLEFGAEKGYNPSETFNTSKYLKKFPNFTQLGINPLVHHILYKNTAKSDFKLFGDYYEQCLDEPLDSFILNNFSNYQIKKILKSLSTEIPIIVPMFSLKCDIYGFIYNLVKNTNINFKLYFFTNTMLKPKIENNTKYFTDLKYDIIETNSFYDFYTHIINFISKLNSDLVILNCNTEVNSKWLNKLIYSAHMDDEIGFVSPLSNFSFTLSKIIDEVNLTTDKINYMLQKNKNQILNTPYFDGACIFIKQNVIQTCNFNDYSFVLNNEEKTFGFKLNQNEYKHVLDLSNYVYTKEDFEFLLDGFPKNNLQFNLEIKRFLNSSELISLNSKIIDFNDDKVDKNILYVSNKDDSIIINDFLINSIKSNYNCYFLNYSDESIKIWAGKDLICEYSSENIENLNFNLLNYLNIDLVHIFDIDDFSYNFAKEVNSLKIPLFVSCYDRINKHIIEKLLNCSKHMFIDKSIRSLIDERFFNKISEVNFDIIKKFNKLKNTRSNMIKIFIPGDIDANSQNLEIFKEFEMKNEDNILEFHFLGKIPNFLNMIGINHGKFTHEKFLNIIENIKPDFIGIFNIFPKIFDICDIYPSFEIPLLALNDEKIPYIIDGLNGTYLVPNKTPNILFKEIINAYEWKNYYSLLKNIIHSNEKYKLEMLKISNNFETQYQNLNVESNFEFLNNENLFYAMTKFNILLNSTCGSFFINDYDKNIKKYFINLFPEKVLKEITSDKKPLITVIVPVHNNFNQLLISLDSILNQSYSNIEVIIVDGYSTDGTQEILDDLSKNNIKIFRQKQNNGFYAACNVGLKNASGDYIFYFDLNSEWDYRYVEIMVNIFSSHDIDVLYSGELICKNHNADPFCVKFNGNNFIDLRCCCHKKQINDISKISTFNSLSVPITCIKYYLNNKVFDFEKNIFKNSLIESNSINILLQNECLNQQNQNIDSFNKFIELISINQKLKIDNTRLNEKNSCLQKNITDLKEKISFIESKNSNLEHKLDSCKYEILDLKKDKIRLINENKMFLEDILKLKNK